jgi:gamma-glutamyltranspeptidase / glutathione hydrolase
MTLIRFLICLFIMCPALAQSDARLNQGPKPGAQGESVMVSTQLPIVTETALEVLRNGGNAVDAMITAVFLQHVVDYHQVSHFGIMSGIFYEAATGEYHVISGNGVRPLASRCGTGDPSAVSIGGTVKAMEALASRWGTLNWSDYLQPAIEAAETGVEVSSFMYGINYHFMQTGEDDSLIGNREAREFYMPDGFLVPVGERWKMPALAEHLRTLAEQGAGYMYTGGWAEKFVEAARGRGHCVSSEDLAEYEVVWQEPVRFTYGDHQIIGSAPPDTGGAFVGLSLNMLQHFGLAERPHYSESAETLEIMARVFGRASDETRLTINDPLAVRVPVEIWADPAYGAMAAELVRQTMPLEGVSLAPPESSDNDDPESMGSDHNVIVDANGNWFSVLHTGHGGAPGVFIDGVAMRGSTARAFIEGPGRRLVLPITAIMVERDGEPWLAMGSPGMPPQPVTQTLVNILDWNMDPVDAAAAPRFWAWRNNQARIDIESRISDQVRSGIRAAGLELRDLGPYFWSTGSMQIIWRDAETGRLHGATDPRRLGWAEGF